MKNDIRVSGLFDRRRVLAMAAANVLFAVGIVSRGDTAEPLKVVS